MTEPTAGDPKKEKKSFLSFLAWWQVDAGEIEKQVAQYDTLKVTHSARGISMLLCVFTVAVTVLLGSFMGLSTDTITIEAVIWLILAFFMYRAHRWAFIAGMLLWTAEKGFQLVGGAAGASPIVQVIWWAIYLKPFLLGFRVERRRAALSATPRSGG